jgi:hypothetical protein
MTTNSIPRPQADVLNLVLIARSGAQAHGVAAGLEHNPAAALDADYFDFAGNPATPEVLGKQALLNAQLLTIKTTGAVMQTALKNGRKFCLTGFGLLKPVIGHRWNGDWNAAGFTAGTLAVPRVPLSTLEHFRAYLVANPARESVSAGFTAAAAQTHVTAIQNAIQARDTAKGLRWTAKAARDASFKQIRKRLSDLRSELSQLLSPTDARWYAFGFRRPADGSMPSLVPDLVLTPAGASVVLVQWGLASLAANYRVSWRLSGSAAEPTEVGLFTDRQCSITGLPSGASIVVGVSARNDSGETEPTEAAIMVG